MVSVSSNPRMTLYALHSLLGALFRMSNSKALQVSAGARVALAHESVASEHGIYMPNVL